MKLTTHFNPCAAARLVLAAACILVLAAACTTDDDPSWPHHDNGTPDAPVPLTFTALRPAPMTDADTRAVPGMDEWKGDGTEKIGVRLYESETNNTVDTGIYTVTDRNGTVEALPGDKAIFWPDKTGSYYIWASYPLPGKYDISDQSTPEKLTKADFIQASVVNYSPDGGPVTLQLGHVMAKIRVELTGVAPDARDVKVEIRYWNSITLRYFSLALDTSDDQAYITACRDASTTQEVAFEALVPTIGSVVKENFIRITVGNHTYFFTPEGNEIGLVSFPKVGGVYTYRITLPASATSAASTAAPASRHLAVSNPTVKPFNTSER